MSNLNSLNAQQRQAVETIHGPVLVLAGAGSGKTRVITARIGHLIHRGVAPGHILAVTFTNKAAREMQERVAKMLPRKAQRDASRRTANEAALAPRPGVDNTSQRADEASALLQRPTICTFHSLCVRILRRHIGSLGYKPNFVIYNDSEQLGVVRRILAHISGEKTDPVAVLAALSRLRSMRAGATWAGDPKARGLAEHIRARYESALRACNALDFDDLLLLALRLFKDQPAALEACRDTYRYVMVDEYQDTNAPQFDLVYALTREHGNLCVVGDDDQSIYGWRGAEIANLLELERYFPKVKVIRLEQNYRSTNTILKAANALICHNVRRRPKRLWSQNGDGEKITLHTFADEEQEARGIVEEIDYARKGHRQPWSAHAILFRTNIQSRPLETALRQAQVRYHLIGGQSFFDRREVRDFLAYLKTILNPKDDVSLLRIANVPARGLSDETMEKLLAASHERKCSVFEAMRADEVLASFSARIGKSIRAFVSLIEEARATVAAGILPAPPLSSGKMPDATGALGQWAERFLDQIGYFAELMRLEKTPEAGEDRVRNVKDLIATLDRTGALSEPATERLQSFLEDITLDSEREEADEAPGDAVTLITMHSCKGLEFPHVHIVGMEDGLLPHTRSKLEGTLDEERRLFYVAITRAMQTLAISHCAARNKYGSKSACQPSPFLLELPPELIEHASEKGKRPVSVDQGKEMFERIRAGL